MLHPNQIQQAHAAFHASLPQQVSATTGHAGTKATSSARMSKAGKDNPVDHNSNKNDNNPHSDQMVARHLQSTARDVPVTTEQDHLLRQRRVFDEMSSFFATQQTIPDELVPVYHHLAAQIYNCVPRRSPLLPIRILDVACGSGALFDFLLQQHGEMHHSARPLHITGVDLAPQMVAAARKHAAALLAKSAAQVANTTIQVVESDILQYTLSTATTNNNPPPEEEEEQRYDVIVLNACFGNFWNPSAVLRHLRDHLLAERGSIVVSHPLGASFVARLHAEDRRTVPHVLPTSVAQWTWLLLLGQSSSSSSQQATHEKESPSLHCTMLDLCYQEAPYYFCRLEPVRNS